MARKPPAGHAAIARQIAGLGPKAKLPAKGTSARRSYDTAMRGLQRSEAAGKVNPKTGAPLQARPSRRVHEAAEKITAERKALRKPTVTVRGMKVTTTINGDRRYTRVRELGDVTMTRAQFRALQRLDKAEDDELLAQLVANVSDRIADLQLAPGVQTLDVSDVRFSRID